MAHVVLHDALTTVVRRILVSGWVALIYIRAGQGWCCGGFVHDVWFCWCLAMYVFLMCQNTLSLRVLPSNWLFNGGLCILMRRLSAISNSDLT